MILTAKSVSNLMVSSSPALLMQSPALTGELSRPCFLMTVPFPTGPGLPWAEPSVNIITIVWSVTGSRTVGMYVFSASSDLNLSGIVNIMLGIQNILKEGGVSVGILIRWESILRFLEMVVKSCLT